tara:strand:+ start:232 stop:1398 length:1167 start_codon:yes stop_codon:yes gene_type:complete
MTNHNPKEPKFLFLVGAPRSANSAILALLDNHPDILSWPSEFYFAMTFNRISKGNTTAPVKELNTAFIAHFEDRFGERLSINTLGDTHSKFDIKKSIGPFDIELFKDLLNIRKSEVMGSIEYLRHFFQCFHSSHEHYKNKEVKYYGMLCTARGFDWSSETLLANSRLIFPYRKPLESYASLREKYLKTISPNEFFDLRASKGAVYWLKTYKKINTLIERHKSHPNLHITSVNKFREDQRSQIAELCDFLEIPATKSTSDMTILGIPYGGNARQNSLNTGTIAKQPSILNNPATTFEEYCFDQLNLLDFDNPRNYIPKHRTLIPYLLALQATFIGIKKNPNGLTKSSLKYRFIPWRVKMFVQLINICKIVRNPSQLANIKSDNIQDSLY